MAEKFSFTDPKVPLFGPEYQKKKEEADKAMKELRRVMEQLDGKAKDDSGIAATLQQLQEELLDARAEGDKKMEKHLQDEIARIKREAAGGMAKDAAFAYGYGLGKSYGA